MRISESVSITWGQYPFRRDIDPSGNGSKIKEMTPLSPFSGPATFFYGSWPIDDATTGYGQSGTNGDFRIIRSASIYLSIFFDVASRLAFLSLSGRTVLRSCIPQGRGTGHWQVLEKNFSQKVIKRRRLTLNPPTVRMQKRAQTTRARYCYAIKWKAPRTN